MSENSSDNRFHNQLADPMTEVYFHRIKSVLKEQPEIVNTLEEQFLANQILSLDDFSKEILKVAKIGDNEYRIDILWGHLRSLIPTIPEVAVYLGNPA